MIKNKSRQTSMLVTLEVQKDLTNRGWMVMRSEEESPYDLIVDMGVNEQSIRQFVTIQVKKNIRTSSRPSPYKDVEPVSINGKNRNNYWYCDEDITYLATIKNNRVVYYHKNDYQKLTPSQLNKINESVFPVNNKMNSYSVSYSVQEGGLDMFWEGNEKTLIKPITASGLTSR